MKFKNLLLILVVLLGISSCGKDANTDTNNAPDLNNLIELTQEELISVIYDNAGTIAPEEAIQLVNNFQEMLNKTKGTRAAQSSDFVIKQVYNLGFNGDNLLYEGLTRSVGEEVIVASVYEVSMNNDKGIVLVSGDERSPSILAYVPELPNPDDLGAEQVNLMLEWSKASFMAGLKKQKDIRDELRDATIQKIATELSISPEEVTDQIIADNTYVKYDDVIHTRASQPVHSIPGQIFGYCIPLMQTNWSQGSPYNSKCPINDKVSDGWGGYTRTNVPAGCAVVNLAQLFALCEPTMVANGTNINWSILKQTPEITNSSSEVSKNMVADLIRQIYNETNAFQATDSQGIVIGTGVSSSDYSRVLYSRINGNSEISYDADVVYSSLLSFQPVAIHGEGHAFSLDGYIISEKMTRQLLKIYDIYWHAVLGWGGSYTAWYKLDSDTHLIFQTGGHQFNTRNLKIISHIRPK